MSRTLLGGGEEEPAVGSRYFSLVLKTEDWRDGADMISVNAEVRKSERISRAMISTPTQQLLAGKKQNGCRA